MAGEAANKVCRRVSACTRYCKHYGTITSHSCVCSGDTCQASKVFVNSGIRYDLASLDDEFVEELALHHVQGHMSVAPEHAASDSLKYMKKPERDISQTSWSDLKSDSDAGKNFWCPISSVPIQGLDQKSALSLPYT